MILRVDHFEGVHPPLRRTGAHLNRPKGAPMNPEEIMAEVMARPHYYVFNEDHSVRTAKDVIEWAVWMAWAARRVVVARSYISPARLRPGSRARQEAPPPRKYFAQALEEAAKAALGAEATG